MVAAIAGSRCGQQQMLAPARPKHVGSLSLSSPASCKAVQQSVQQWEVVQSPWMHPPSSESCLSLTSPPSKQSSPPSHAELTGLWQTLAAPAPAPCKHNASVRASVSEERLPLPQMHVCLPEAAITIYSLQCLSLFHLHGCNSSCSSKSSRRAAAAAGTAAAAALVSAALHPMRSATPTAASSTYLLLSVHSTVLFHMHAILSLPTDTAAFSSLSTDTTAFSSLSTGPPHSSPFHFLLSLLSSTHICFISAIFWLHSCALTSHPFFCHCYQANPRTTHTQCLHHPLQLSA